MPQGSVAGPMLYTVYTSMIESVLEAGNQTKDTLLSNLRKSQMCMVLLMIMQWKAPLRPLIDKLIHEQYQILSLVHQT